MTDPTPPERLAEIKAKPFADLTPAEMLEWSVADSDGYYEAARRDARRVIEEEARAALRRRREHTRERLLAPFRRLLGGRRG